MIDYYGWHYDGVFVKLGSYEDIADAMEENPDDIVWYLDKEALTDLLKSGKEIYDSSK
jgi:hypothetical protein